MGWAEVGVVVAINGFERNRKTKKTDIATETDIDGRQKEKGFE